MNFILLFIIKKLAKTIRIWNLRKYSGAGAASANIFPARWSGRCSIPFFGRLSRPRRRKEAFHYDLWAKRIAPSTSLRVWYHGDPAGRWAEFRRKYLDELGSSAAMQDFLDRIRTYPDVTLLYASKNRVENHAVILKEFIEKNLN